MFKKYKGKNVLIVGLGKTGFALINFFNQIQCNIHVTDIKPIFDLNKEVKKLKKIEPKPEMTLGEHKEADFINADIIVYSPAINPKMPQLERARQAGKEVYSEFSFCAKFCDKPIIAVGGSKGRTTIAHMIGFMIKNDKKMFSLVEPTTIHLSIILLIPKKTKWNMLLLKSLQENYKPLKTLNHISQLSLT